MTESLEVRAADGHVTRLEVFGAAGDPAVLFLPGLGVPISYYRPFLSLWAAAGYRVHGLELRGMPHSSITDVRATDFGYRHALELDIPAALAAMSGTLAVLAGHSLGGQLALLSAASNPGLEVPVVAIAAGSSYHGTVGTRRGRRIRRRQAAAVRVIVRALGYFPGHRLGFGGRQPRSMMRDWAFEAQTGRYELDGSEVDHEAALGQLRGRVLMLTLAGDKLITEAAAAHLAARLASASAATERVGVAENHGAPFNHFRWARTRPAAILRPIVAWLSPSETQEPRAN